ncbi:MAG: hypothetical protein RIR95_44 [Pseudomonadota bacterium]
MKRSIVSVFALFAILASIEPADTLGISTKGCSSADHCFLEQYKQIFDKFRRWSEKKWRNFVKTKFDCLLAAINYRNSDQLQRNSQTFM